MVASLEAALLNLANLGRDCAEAVSWNQQSNQKNLAHQQVAQYLPLDYIGAEL